MSDDREPIIDAMLDELLGGSTPPDLKEQILAVHRSEQPSQRAAAEQPRIVTRPRRTPSRRRVAQQRSHTRIWTSVAVMLLGAVSFGGWFAYQQREHHQANLPPQVAPTPAPLPESPLVQTQTPLPPSPIEETPVEVTPPAPQFVEKTFDDPNQVAQANFPTFKPVPATEAAWGDERLVNYMERAFERNWKGAEVPIAEAANQREWFARTYRFLLGTTPSRLEMQQVERERNRDKIVASLMGRPEFVDHWSKRLTELLVGQYGPQEKSVERAQLQTYLRDALADGKRYDQLAFELITATGSNNPEAEDFNPAVNFLLAHQGTVRGRTSHRERKKVDATNMVSQVFLGRQTQCAQCHDAPGSALTQDDFWQMAAFFVQMRHESLAGNFGRLGDVDFTGDQGTPSEAELAYRAVDGESRSVYPVLIGGAEPGSRSGVASELHRRAALAQLVVESDGFAKTAVNRIWDYAFGRGFTFPIDDVGAHVQPAHPELFDRLATEFRNSGYDLRAALRWVTLSSPFQLQTVNPAADTRLFNGYAQVMLSDYPQIPRSLTQLVQNAERGSLGLAQSDHRASERDKFEAWWRYQVKKNNELLDTSEGSMLRKVARSEALNDQQKVEHVFWAVLGRRPTGRERNQGQQLLDVTSSESDASALKEIGAVLLHSPEFAAQH